MKLDVAIFNVPIDDVPLELLNSIKIDGVKEPIIIDRVYYTLLDGEKRIAACKLLGITKIPYIYSEMSKDEVQQYIAAKNKTGHSWKEMTPGVWQCQKCLQWTKCGHRPRPHASLMDLSSDQPVSLSQTECLLPPNSYSAIEHHLDLHECLTVGYLIDGYSITLVYKDGSVTGPYVRGQTIQEAMTKLNELLQGKDRASVRKQFTKD